MRNSAEQRDLIRHPSCFEDYLALMPLLGREYGVSLRCRDGNRAFSRTQLLLLYPAWVRNEPDIDFAEIWSEMANDIFRSETVADGANFLQRVNTGLEDESPWIYFDSVFRSQLFNTSIDDGIDILRGMSFSMRVVFAIAPSHDIKVARTVQWDWIAIKELGNDYNYSSKFISFMSFGRNVQ
jgi:hypothetical protein